MRKTIEEGINIEPTNVTGTQDGDLWVDSSDNKLKYYSNGQVNVLSTSSSSESTFLNNQVTPAPVANFNFSNDVKYFKASVYINRGANGESVELVGVNSSTGWQLSTNNALGDDTGVDFSINAGQVEYTSTPTGIDGTIVFKAQSLEYTV